MQLMLDEKLARSFVSVHTPYGVNMAVNYGYPKSGDLYIADGKVWSTSGSYLGHEYLIVTPADASIEQLLKERGWNSGIYHDSQSLFYLGDWGLCLDGNCYSLNSSRRPDIIPCHEIQIPLTSDGFVE